MTQAKVRIVYNGTAEGAEIFVGDTKLSCVKSIDISLDSERLPTAKVQMEVYVDEIEFDGEAALEIVKAT